MNNKERITSQSRRMLSAVFVFVLLFSVVISLHGQGNTWYPLYRNWVEHDTIWTITNNGTRYVAVGDGGYTWISSDGFSWNKGTKLTSNCYGSAYGGGKFVVGGQLGRIWRSTDGVNWTQVSTGLSTHIWDVGYDSDRDWFLASAEEGWMSVSKDGGVTWTAKKIVGASTIGGCGAGNGVLMGAAAGGWVYTSTDGTTWESHSVSPTHLYVAMYHLVGATHTYVVAGRQGKIYTSTDLNTWTPTKPAGDDGIFLFEGAHTGSKFVLGGEYDSQLGPIVAPVFTSSDGYTWSKKDSKAYNACVGLTHNASQNRLLMTGAYMTIVYSDLTGASVQCTSPSGQPGTVTTLQVGATHEITWTTTGTVGALRLEYSTSGFDGTFHTIATDVPSASGSYNWTVPSESSSNCVVKISEMADGVPAHYSAPFTIGSGSGSGTLTITSPNGGETLTPGTNYTVRWSSTGTVGLVRLRYSTNGGSTWTIFANNQTNTGSYSWAVPNVNSSNCLVRINEINADGIPNDQSDSAFTIGEAGARTLNLTAPNGGEVLAPGSKYTVRWTSSGGVGPVRLRYSIDGGANYTLFANNLPNTGSYSWTVPNVNSDNCLVRINEINASGEPNDESDSIFTIGTPPDGSITIISPNGGESLAAGSTAIINWTSEGSIGSIKLEYSANNGSSWTQIVSGTSNDGAYGWNVPNANGSQYLVRATSTIYGSIMDVSDRTFSVGVNGSVTVTSPNGGEQWLPGSIENITWNSSGAVGNVKIEYSLNNGGSWTTIVSSTNNDGSHAWSLPSTTSDNCLVRVTDVSVSSITDRSNAVFSIGGTKTIALDRERLVFGYVQNGGIPGAQTIIVSNSGAGTLNWSAAGSASWFNIDPTSGNGGGIVSVTIDPTGLGLGSYTGTINFTDPDADNSPVSATVELTVKSPSQAEVPFGSFETPADGSTVSSSIAVSGWALDDTGVKSLQIFADGSYIGEAVFVEGARPDIPQEYPNYPDSTKAGWGYMMLTNFLPNGGNGTYVITAKATDYDGNVITLGSKTIYVDNVNATKPFGALDTPFQGGVASGSNFINWGWCLTPQPNTIPKDASTILVWVDAKPIGHPVYNNYREDIAKKFPGLNNSDGASGYFYIDTTSYDNGVHNISWSVTDNGGNADGIGSRYFTILNFGTSSDSNTQSQLAQAETSVRQIALQGPIQSQRHGTEQIKQMPEDFQQIFKVRTGYNPSMKFHALGTNGKSIVTIKELGRLEIKTEGDASLINGYMLMGDKVTALPIGSHLDTKTGTFYWAPGAGFCGTYHFVFIMRDIDGFETKKNITVKVGFEAESKLNAQPKDIRK